VPIAYHEKRHNDKKQDILTNTGNHTPVHLHTHTHTHTHTQSHRYYIMVNCGEREGRNGMKDSTIEVDQ
jgi:hypothetical protein